MFTRFWQGLFADAGDGGGGGGGSGDGGTIFNGGGDSGGGDKGGQGNQGGGDKGAGGGQQQGGGSASPVAWLTDSLDEKGAFKQGWTDRLPDTLKPAKDTLARYQTPEAALFGLHNLNVKLGAKANAIVPLTDKSTPAEIAEFRKALGVPGDEVGYELKKPADLPAEIAWDDARIQGYAKVFLKHNIPKAAAAELLAMQVEEQKAQLASEVEGNKAFVATQIGELRKEWGDQSQANFAKAKTMAVHLGLDLNDPALAFGSVAKALLKAHAILAGEDKRIDGKTVIAEDPGAEADRIQTDKSHNLYGPYHDKNDSRHEYAVQTLRDLRQRAEAAGAKK